MAAGRRNRTLAAVTGALLLLAGCAGGPPAAAPAATLDKLEIALAEHIAVLASDEYEGRRPGTPGEAKTLAYLAREWQAAGLQSGTNVPAHPWFAPVRLALSIPDASRFDLFRDGRRIEIGDDEVRVFTTARRDLLDSAPLVYVGREGASNTAIAGRIALMEWDHPDRVTQRDSLIDGGAAAVIAVVDPEEFDEQVELRRRGTYRLQEEQPDLLDGFITADAVARALGPDGWARIRDEGAQQRFAPVPLGMTAAIEATSTPGEVLTHNLIAKLPGKRPDDKAVLMLAHWDHFGTCSDADGIERICNGAVDNASGLAVLTEAARILAAGPRPDRDIYFLATTAEEWGLLGAQAFVREPPLPLDSIVAAFNIDSIAVAPRGSPVAVVGAGRTGLDPAISQIVESTGRRVANGDIAGQYLQRQDGWALLQADIPAVMVSSAFADGGPLGAYTRDRYHKPTDKAPVAELGGAAEDLLLHVALARHFATIAPEGG